MAASLPPRAGAAGRQRSKGLIARGERPIRSGEPRTWRPERLRLGRTKPGRKGFPVKRLTLVCSLASLALLSGGCYATKIISVPMRVVGAVTSVVPFVGNTTHDAIDGAADTLDDLL